MFDLFKENLLFGVFIFCVGNCWFGGVYNCFMIKGFYGVG